LCKFVQRYLLSKLNHPNGKCYCYIRVGERHYIFIDNEMIDYIDPELTDLIKNYLKEKSFKYLNAIEKISIQIIFNNKK